MLPTSALVTLFLLGSLTLFAAAASSDSGEDAIARQVLAGVPVSFFRDESSSSSSSSDDDDEADAVASDDSSLDERQARIAAAIKAAVAKPAVTPAAAPYKNFRLRLATQAQPNTCVYPCSTGIYEPVTSVAAIQGVRVIVGTTNGTLSAKFNSSGIAQLNDNFFRFTVVFAPRGNGVFGQFTLSTIASLSSAIPSGVNVTSFELRTQDRGDSNSTFGQTTFLPFNTTDGNFRNATAGLSLDGRVRAVAGASTYGCSPNGGLGQQDYSQIVAPGVDSVKFTMVNSGDLFVSHTGAASNQTFVFQIGNVQRFRSNARAELYKAIGLQNLPCATRNAFNYDEIVIATSRNQNGVRFNPFDNPVLFDALKSGSATPTPNINSFVQQLRLSAGRTQLSLRDVVVDRMPFSIRSHFSKFTPCFRIWPDEDYRIDVYLLMSGAKNSTIGGQIVYATLTDQGLVIPAAGGNPARLLDIAPIDYTLRPKFVVNEVAFANLTEGTTTGRQRTLLDSDVSVLLDTCPTFSYFQ